MSGRVLEHVVNGRNERLQISRDANKDGLNFLVYGWLRTRCTVTFC